MKMRVRSFLAILLVAVFVLGALNVSGAGQRDRLRQKVRTLSQRVAALEAAPPVTVQQLHALQRRTKWLLEDTDPLRSGVYIGPVEGILYDRDCPADTPAVWVEAPDDTNGTVMLSCSEVAP